jgi:hypothetical protein
MTDHLNALLVEAADNLRQLNFGVPCVIILTDSTPLRWGRHKNAWDLWVGTGNDIQRLVEASRPTRVLAAHALPQLYLELQKNVAAELVSVREAIEALAAFNRSFHTPEPT